MNKTAFIPPNRDWNPRSDWTCFRWLQFLCCFIDDDQQEKQNTPEMQHLVASNSKSIDEFPAIAPVGRLAYPKSLQREINNNACPNATKHKTIAKDIHCPLSDGGCGMVYWYLPTDVQEIIEHRGEPAVSVVVGMTVRCPCKKEIVVSEGSLQYIRIIPEDRDIETALSNVRDSREHGERTLDKLLSMQSSGEGYVDSAAFRKTKHRIQYLKQRQFELTGLFTHMTEVSLQGFSTATETKRPCANNCGNTNVGHYGSQMPRRQRRPRNKGRQSQSHSHSQSQSQLQTQSQQSKQEQRTAPTRSPSRREDQTTNATSTEQKG